MRSVDQSGPLESLYKLRSDECDQIEQVFTSYHLKEREAESLWRRSLQIKKEEQEKAENAQRSGDEASIQEFSVWLPYGQKEIEETYKRYQKAKGECEVAHQELIQAQAALQAVEKLREQHKVADVRASLLKEQMILDEIALRHFIRRSYF
ncbi:flagellar FliJ family protein [Swingsia samuiensis]|uniref:Flagellar FliJ protein n=1 Tax=Swingsia samuiensis TaxID=1293412 RepID=A0A4Y6UI72_9PROT|nr:flagellar export protein FliJ [Swingsia samuiensis]QDH17299.1 hypothetical protein E3D00_06790 [Swingsia samuiensis]